MKLQKQQLSDRMEDQKASLCANKDHIIRRLNDEIGGLKRTINTYRILQLGECRCPCRRR